MKIELPIVVVVTDRQSHSGLLTTILIQSNTRWISRLFKSSIPFIDVKLFRSRVVHHDQVQKIVIVYIHECRRKAIELLGIAYPSLNAGVFETAIGLLVIKR